MSTTAYRGGRADGGFDPPEVLARLASGSRAERLLHVREVPAREARLADWPDWVHPSVYAACAGSGVHSLWEHQRTAADLARDGQHVVMATGTASGKSLGFLLPVLTALVDGAEAPTGRGVSALYLSPTKALAADQLDRLQRLAVPGIRAATYDGDTPSEERHWIREHAHLVLSNPDLVHFSMLPQHPRWAPFLRALRFVVIDECHVYRGVFGSHLAALLRRLRRVAARYGSFPTFVLASATVRDPAVHAERLLGLPVHAVERDGSPRAAMTFAMWEPAALPGSASHGAAGAGPAAEGDPAAAKHDPGEARDDSGEARNDSGETPARRSATSEAADLLADLVAQGVHTVAFARSRAGVEALAASARRSLAEVHPGLEAAVAAYRGGYLPEERRELERALRGGGLVGVAATTALELGIDISGLDAVLLAGWPGTRASLWQQAGRAGRAGERSLGICVTRASPRDTSVVRHPEVVFGQPVEATVLDPHNPHVLAPHLAAAAAELPLTAADLPMFGPRAPELVDALVARGILRRRPSGWFWARQDRAADHVSLRGSGEVVGIVEQRTGRVLGTIDEPSAHSQVHTGAVHVHQGESYVVTELDLEGRTACVVRGDPGWSTYAQSVSAFDIVGTERSFAHGPVEVSFGSVRVHTRVTSFLRRLPSGEIIGTHPLDLPQRTLPTKAVWWTMPVTDLLAAGVEEADIPGAAHAAEHAAIGMLPLVATSDRWDIGGVSTAQHPDTGLPTIMVYDGHPGGAGFAERAFESFQTWLRATRDAVDGCRCESGCPACVQSPKCGNGNSPLDKSGAVRLLDMVLGHTAATPSREAEPQVTG